MTIAWALLEAEAEDTRGKGTPIDPKNWNLAESLTEALRRTLRKLFGEPWCMLGVDLSVVSSSCRDSLNKHNMEIDLLKNQYSCVTL